MPDINSLTSFSGVLTFVATLAAISGRLLTAGTLLIIAGVAGLAIVWDRWSLRSGEQVHFSAFFSPADVTADDIYMLATHGPLLALGLVFVYLRRPRGQEAQEEVRPISEASEEIMLNDLRPRTHGEPS